MTTNCVSGYNVYRSISATGPWTTPLNSSPQTGVTYQDQTAVVGQTYTYAIMAFSIACTQTGPPASWTFCGSSAPLLGTLTVPTAPGGVVGFAWSVQ